VKGSLALGAKRSLAIQRLPERTQHPPKEFHSHRDHHASSRRPYAVAGRDAREFAQGHEQYVAFAEADDLGWQGSTGCACDPDEFPDRNLQPLRFRHQARNPGNSPRHAEEQGLAEAITERDRIDHDSAPMNNRPLTSDL